jgi:hypothetical protein
MQFFEKNPLKAKTRKSRVLKPLNSRSSMPEVQTDILLQTPRKNIITEAPAAR